MKAIEMFIKKMENVTNVFDSVALEGRHEEKHVLFNMKKEYQKFDEYDMKIWICSQFLSLGQDK